MIAVLDHHLPAPIGGLTRLGCNSPSHAFRNPSEARHTGTHFASGPGRIRHSRKVGWSTCIAVTREMADALARWSLAFFVCS